MITKWIVIKLKQSVVFVFSRTYSMQKINLMRERSRYRAVYFRASNLAKANSRVQAALGQQFAITAGTMTFFMQGLFICPLFCLDKATLSEESDYKITCTICEEAALSI